MSESEFETVYNVEMTCESCVNDITSKLTALNGVSKVSCDLDNKVVAVIGSEPPSTILSQLKNRSPILRGTGKSNSAAVSILENFECNDDLKVKGLVRFVGLPNKNTFVDLKMSGIDKNVKEFDAYIAANGDLSSGSKSTGEVWTTLGKLKCENGICELYKTFNFNLYEIIGRSVVVENPDVKYCGVIARSAGAWENSKYVCSCTGKTIWDERLDAVKKGI